MAEQKTLAHVPRRQLVVYFTTHQQPKADTIAKTQDATKPVKEEA